MKRLVLLLILGSLLCACNRSTCPAYSNGEMTGTEGSREKKQQLFSPQMEKKKR